MHRSPSVTRRKMVEEAQRRGWQVSYFGPQDYYYRITNTAGKSCIFHGSIPQSSSWIGSNISVHKLRSLEYLQDKGMKLVPFMLYKDESSATAFLKAHAPIVVKPEDSEQSKGVTVDITTVDQLTEAIANAHQYSPAVLLQKQLFGRLYRLLAIDGTFFAASYRRAAFVTGDGERTVAELIEAKNSHPWRGTDGNAILKIINLDNVAKFLGSQDALKVIPKTGEEVKVSPVDSVSAGGEAADVTDLVHQDYRTVIESVAQELNIVSCGFDIMVEDISQPMPAFLPFLEMNSAPGFKIHYYPSAGGKPRDVASALLDAMLGKI